MTFEEAWKIAREEANKKIPIITRIPISEIMKEGLEEDEEIFRKIREGAKNENSKA